MSETEKAEKGAMGDDEEGEVLTDPKVSFALSPGSWRSFIGGNLDQTIFNKLTVFWQYLL